MRQCRSCAVSMALRLPFMASRFRFGSPGPARPFMAGRSAGHAAVPLMPGFRWRCGCHPWRHVFASDRPARPFMAGRSAGHAAVPLMPGFRWRCGCHPWRHVFASDRPARPFMAGRSAGHAAVPRKRPASPPSQRVHYFHAIPVAERMFAMPPTRDDFTVDLHRHAALAKPFGLHELQHGGLRRDRARLAVQLDLHSRIVAPRRHGRPVGTVFDAVRRECARVACFDAAIRGRM